MEFKYKKNKIFGDLLFGYLFLFFTLFITTMILRKFLLNWNEFQTQKILFALISIVLFSFLTYLFLGTAIIRNNYYKRNLREEIKLDKQNRKIIVISRLNNVETKVDFDDIKSVELYYSWSTNPFSSDLGYSKLNLFKNENSIIITQNNLNQYQIYKALKRKVIKNKSNFMNAIKA